MDDFERELKVSFLDEAAQALSEVEQCFLSLESDPENEDNLNKIFRLAHNLKGSSKAVGFMQMGEFTHEFETYILKIKNKEMVCTPKAVSFLLQCNDHLVSMVNGLKENLEAQFDSSELMDQMKNWTDEEAVVEPAVEEPVVEEPVVEAQVAEALVAEAPAIEMTAEVSPTESTSVDKEISFDVDEVEKLLQMNASQMEASTVTVSPAPAAPVQPAQTQPTPEAVAKSALPVPAAVVKPARDYSTSTCNSGGWGPGQGGSACG